jgi:hypothetical protein
MQWEALLADPTWQEVQSLWRALADWPPKSEPTQTEPLPVPWEQLRLLLEYALLALQPLVLKQVLSPQALENVRILLHLRLDRRLVSTQARPTTSPYQLQPDPYLRPPYHRYHALQALEQQIKTLKQTPFFMQRFSMAETQNILEDLNLDLLEIYARLLGPEARENHWPMVLETIIALELPLAENSISPAQIELKIAQFAPLALAEDILMRSRFSGALRAALSILKEAQDLSQALPALRRLVLSPGQHSLTTAALGLLKKFSEEEVWTVLSSLLEENMPDSHQAEGAFGQVRWAALDVLSQFQNHEYQTLAQPLLRTGIHAAYWSNLSRLKAIQILAKWGHPGYLEEVIGALKSALAQDHREEMEAALEALKTLQDPRSIPILVELLRHLSRSDTVLENLRQAFHSDRTPIQEGLLKTLKVLGHPLSYDPVSLQWLPENGS